MPDASRLNVVLPGPATDDLDHLVARTGATKTDVTIRALRLLRWWIEQEADGREHAMQDGVRTVVVRMF